MKTRDRTTAPHPHQAVDFRRLGRGLAAEKVDSIFLEVIVPFVAFPLCVPISARWTREWSHRINPSLRVREMTIDALRESPGWAPHQVTTGAVLG